MKGLLLTARAHSLTAMLLLGLALAWLLVGATRTLALPRIYPDNVDLARPMESLSTLAIAIPAAFSGYLAGNRLTWLTDTSPRRQGLWRSLWFLIVTVCQLGLAAVVVSASGSLPMAQVLGVTACVVSIAHLGGRLAGMITGSVLPVAAVLAFSSRRIIPWNANIIYNPALLSELWAVALLFAATALALTVWEPRWRRFVQ